MSAQLSLLPECTVEPALPDPGEFYWRLLLRLKAELARAAKIFDALHREEGVWVPEVYLRAVGEDIIDTDKALAHFYQYALSSLVKRAQDEFAPPGVRLEIDLSALQDAVGIDRSERKTAFDPRAAWQWLSQTFGGDAGERLAFCQASAAIVRYLRLDQCAPRTVSGRVLVERQVWTETRWNGRRELTYHTAEELQKFLSALCAFLRWAERHGEAAELMHSRPFGNWHDREVTLREKLSLCSGIELTTYYSKLEFRFSLALAEQLQLFVGTFGGSDE